jgi:hypothetical protein
MSDTPRHRVFLLSPANMNGTRGARALSPGSTGAIAERLRSRDGLALGELFSFISALYFRGKLTYARRFSAPPATVDHEAGIHVITASAGLRSPDTRVTLEAVRAFAMEDIAAGNASYRRPLERSAIRLAEELGDCDVVLLGSIATAKYVDVLLGVFGERLLFPTEFVGRGDMSRGGLLLRCAASGVELSYAPVAGATRRGTRPPKLGPA